MARRTIYVGLTKSEIAMLWGIWRHHVSKYCLEWEEAKDFILWAEKNGYIGGAKLRRKDGFGGLTCQKQECLDTRKPVPRTAKQPRLTGR